MPDQQLPDTATTAQVENKSPIQITPQNSAAPTGVSLMAFGVAIIGLGCIAGVAYAANIYFFFPKSNSLQKQNLPSDINNNESSVTALTSTSTSALSDDSLSTTTVYQTTLKLDDASTSISINSTGTNNSISPSADGLQDITRLKDIQTINYVIKDYFNTKGKIYPASLDILANFAQSDSLLPDGIPSDPVTGESYVYKTTQNLDLYVLCASLSNEAYSCIDPSSNTTLYSFWKSGIDQPVESWSQFQDSTGSFKYSYPGSWVEGSSTPVIATAFYLYAATSSVYSLSQSKYPTPIAEVNAYNITPYIDSSASISDIQGALIAAYAGAQPASVWSETTFHGDPAYVTQIISTYSLGGIVQTVYLIKHNGSFYILSMLYKREEEGLLTKVFDGIKASFIFTK